MVVETTVAVNYSELTKRPSDMWHSDAARITRPVNAYSIDAPIKYVLTGRVILAASECHMYYGRNFSKL